MTIEQERDQLRELKQLWHDKFWEQSKETDLLRKQVKMLRDTIKFWMQAEGNYDLMKADKKFQEALAATEIAALSDKLDSYVLDATQEIPNG